MLGGQKIWVMILSKKKVRKSNINKKVRLKLKEMLNIHTDTSSFSRGFRNL